MFLRKCIDQALYKNDRLLELKFPLIEPRRPQTWTVGGKQSMYLIQETIRNSNSEGHHRPRKITRDRIKERNSAARGQNAVDAAFDVYS